MANENLNILLRKRKEQPERGEDRERIPLDQRIVTSHCKVPCGTAADGAHSLLHTGRGSFGSMENIQLKKERRAEQKKMQFSQEMKWEFSASANTT